MRAAEIARWMAERGFRFEVCGDRLSVIPEPEPKVVARLREVKSELRAFIAEHGGTWPPLAGSHRYVVWSGALCRESTVCLSCGCPPAFHGMNPLTDPVVLDDPSEAPLIDAAAIVNAARERGRETA